LHLKSYDPAIPEISLVLADGMVAGWTSSGQLCGPQFFFEGSRTYDPYVVADRVQKFLNRL